MKRTKKRLTVWLLLFALTAGVFPSVPAEAAKKPKLSSKKLSVTVGKTKKLKVKNARGAVKWKIISGKKYISIKKSAKKLTITGKKKGTAKIRATVGGTKLTCQVTVKKKKTDSANPSNPVKTSVVNGEQSAAPTKVPTADTKPTSASTEIPTADTKPTSASSKTPAADTKPTAASSKTPTADTKPSAAPTGTSTANAGRTAPPIGGNSDSPKPSPAPTGTTVATPTPKGSDAPNPSPSQPAIPLSSADPKIIDMEVKNENQLTFTLAEPCALSVEQVSVKTKEHKEEKYTCQKRVVSLISTDGGKTYTLDVAVHTMLEQYYYVKVSLAKKDGSHEAFTKRFLRSTPAQDNDDAYIAFASRFYASGKFVASLSYRGYSSMEISNLPDGLKAVAKTHNDGIDEMFIYADGTPLKTGVYTSTMSAEDEMDNTLRKTIHIAVGSETELVAVAPSDYYLREGYDIYSDYDNLKDLPEILNFAVAGGTDNGYRYKKKWLDVPQTDTSDDNMKRELLRVTVTDKGNSSLETSVDIVVHRIPMCYVRGIVTDEEGNIPQEDMSIRFINRNPNKEFAFGGSDSAIKGKWGQPHKNDTFGVEIPWGTYDIEVKVTDDDWNLVAQTVLYNQTIDKSTDGFNIVAKKLSDTEMEWVADETDDEREPSDYSLSILGWNCVQFTLDSPRELNTDQISVKSKRNAEGEYKRQLPVRFATTEDNRTYTLYLGDVGFHSDKSSSSAIDYLYCIEWDDYVQVEISTVGGEPACRFEGHRLESDEPKEYTDYRTELLRVGEEFSWGGGKGCTYSSTELPEGLQLTDEGLCGIPEKAGDYNVTVTKEYVTGSKDIFYLHMVIGSGRELIGGADALTLPNPIYDFTYLQASGGTGGYQFEIVENTNEGLEAYTYGSRLYASGDTPGDYHIKVKVTDGAGNSCIFDVLVIIRSPVLTGKVTDLEGNPVPGVAVNIDDLKATTTDSDGKYTLVASGGQKNCCVCVDYTKSYYSPEEATGDNREYFLVDLTGEKTTRDFVIPFYRVQLNDKHVGRWYDDRGVYAGYGEEIYLRPGSYRLHTDETHSVYRYTGDWFHGGEIFRYDANVTAEFTVKDKGIQTDVKKDIIPETEERSTILPAKDTTYEAELNKRCYDLRYSDRDYHAVRFTPETSGTYNLSYDEDDPEVSFYDMSGNKLTKQENGGYELEAGTTYLVSNGILGETTWCFEISRA